MPAAVTWGEAAAEGRPRETKGPGETPGPSAQQPAGWPGARASGSFGPTPPAQGLHCSSARASNPRINNSPAAAEERGSSPWPCGEGPGMWPVSPHCTRSTVPEVRDRVSEGVSAINIKDGSGAKRALLIPFDERESWP